MITVELISFVLVLIPGLLSFIIIENLITQHKIEYKRSIIYVILLNFISFSVSYMTHIVLLKFGFDFFDYLKNDTTNINLSIIIFSSKFIPFFVLWIVLSITIGFCIVYLINKSIIYKIAKFCGVSLKTSNLPVWDDILRIQRESNYVVIRDMRHKLIYYGKLAHYSMLSATEVHLLDTVVYDKNTVLLYKVKEIYLPFSEYMTIEFPQYEN